MRTAPIQEPQRPRKKVSPFFEISIILKIKYVNSSDHKEREPPQSKNRGAREKRVLLPLD